VPAHGRTPPRPPARLRTTRRPGQEHLARRARRARPRRPRRRAHPRRHPTATRRPHRDCDAHRCARRDRRARRPAAPRRHPCADGGAGVRRRAPAADGRGDLLRHPGGGGVSITATTRATRSDAIRAIAVRDFTAVRRSKGVLLPMLIVPFLLLVVLPLGVGVAARAAHPPDVSSMLRALPGGLARPILTLPPRERLVVLVDGYLVAPLFLIVPLMLAAVLAADAFAGEKERKTLESLLHQPVPDRDLFFAKLLGAFVPAVAISWIGFACFVVVVDVTAWPVAHRLMVPTKLWVVVIFWVAPAVAALGLGVMVRVSARASSTQEANQLGGAVILPLIFLAVGQSTGLLLVTLPIALGIGAVVWLIALWLVLRGAQRFTRDRMARTI